MPHGILKNVVEGSFLEQKARNVAAAWKPDQLHGIMAQR